MAVKAAAGIIWSHQLLAFSLSLYEWLTRANANEREQKAVCLIDSCALIAYACWMSERRDVEQQIALQKPHGSILYCRHREILARADMRGKKGRREEKELYFRRGFRWVAFVMEGEDGVISLSVCFRLSLRAPVRKMDELPRELTGSR